MQVYYYQNFKRIGKSENRTNSSVQLQTPADTHVVLV